MAHWTPIWLNLRDRWKTVLAAGLAGLFAFTTARADPFGGLWDDPAPSDYRDPYADQQSLYDWNQEYQRQQRGDLDAELRYQRERDGYINQLEGCNAYTNNARARALCLQGIR